MKFAIPDFALVVLVGPTGSGKSSLARKHFLETEIVSSDRCRALVSDDETDQAATADALDLLHYTLGVRLKRRKLAVVDATSVQKPDRAALIKLARTHHALAVALVLDIDPKLCHERNSGRPNRDFGAHVARNHASALRRSLKGLSREGFHRVHVMRTPEEVDALEIVREPLWTDQRDDHGPFDIIGDVHGCFEELCELLANLGYALEGGGEAGETKIVARHPDGRRLIFVGDIADRGPRHVDCWRLVMGSVGAGTARAVIGNHDHKLGRYLAGRKVTPSHGLHLTIAELETASADFRAALARFIDGLRSHAWLDGGRLVVAHAGLKEEMHGRGSGDVRSFAMFGDTTGEVDEFGLPVRLDWARKYRGEAAVVYGHTPVLEAEWLNNTICIDTGCCFGGRLTALRWPERDLVSVPASRTYAEPARPLEPRSGPSSQQAHDRLLYFDDYAAKRRVVTRLGGTILIPEENSLAALEVMSRFAVDPRWLIHLPATMAACPTATAEIDDGSFLEHPFPALDWFVERGVTDLVAEEKHMGSRALVVVARDAEAAQRRFGVEDGKAGTIYTRTGRPFFKDEAVEAALIARLIAAGDKAGVFDELSTDWLLLDCELMPWSAKAQELLDQQYRPTVLAAATSAGALLARLEQAGDHPDLAALRAKAARQEANAEAMARTLDGYCWPTESLDAYRLAPFHVLAAEGAVFADRPHAWHMGLAERLAAQDPVIQVTGWRAFNVADPAQRQAIAAWWLAHTGRGGEGLVIKPAGFTVKGDKGLIQPAMKVRGRDYLRIIYGPDYDLPENLARLRTRALGRKLSMAEREFKLGLEALHRFVERQPLAKVHECVLGVLALESEPVDPRL